MNIDSTPKTHPLIRLAMRLYNLGYTSGHHDTVESVFTDILEVDLENFHADEVLAIVQDFLGDGEYTEEVLGEASDFPNGLITDPGR